MSESHSVDMIELESLSGPVAFGMEEVPEEEIKGYARTVAEKILADQLSKT